jgi:hypothetical protein
MLLKHAMQEANLRNQNLHEQCMFAQRKKERKEKQNKQAKQV